MREEDSKYGMIQMKKYLHTVEEEKGRGKEEGGNCKPWSWNWGQAIREKGGDEAGGGIKKLFCFWSRRIFLVSLTPRRRALVAAAKTGSPALTIWPKETAPEICTGNIRIVGRNINV